jgi:FO synthase
VWGDWAVWGGMGWMVHPPSRLLEGVLRGGRPLQQSEVELLLRSRGADHLAVCAAADELRRATCGDTVSYVVNRNINYTNVCTYK